MFAFGQATSIKMTEWFVPGPSPARTNPLTRCAGMNGRIFYLPISHKTFKGAGVQRKLSHDFTWHGQRRSQTNIRSGSSSLERGTAIFLPVAILILYVCVCVPICATRRPKTRRNLIRDQTRVSNRTCSTPFPSYWHPKELAALCCWLIISTFLNLKWSFGTSALTHGEPFQHHCQQPSPASSSAKGKRIAVSSIPGLKKIE